MSPEEKAAQAKSFAYGNVHMHNPDVTRAMVDRAYEELYPTAPEPSPEIRLHFAYDEEDMQSLKQECLDMYQAGNHTIKWTPEEAFEYAQKNPSGLIEWLFDGLRSYRSQARAGQATTQSPEIRYKLRNWHHVTCLVAGGACTCLEQREALIAELAKEP